jgi:hypothetical protein
MVDDQEKVLKFYAEVLGFVKKTDIPTGAGLPSYHPNDLIVSSL